MGLFEAFRKDGGPTQYPENITAAGPEILISGFYFAIVIIAFSLLIVTPGVRGGKEKCFWVIRVVVAMFVMGAMFIANFGQEWEVAYIKTATQYRVGLTEDINASIGVWIGLRNVNITLKTDPEIQTFNKGVTNETINYNERFSWNNEGFLNGRFGFGFYASLLNREFRDAQRKGTPYPILWIAEYFTADEEGLRWGRFYRQAGYYTHIVVWTAFPLWIITLLLFNSVILQGAYFSMLTGFCLLFGNVLYALIRNPYPLVIPFPDASLHFAWGWSFWLCMATGIICFVIGFLVIILQDRKPNALNTFFNFDVTSDVVEEFYSDQEIFAVEPTTTLPSIPEGATNMAYDGQGASVEEDPYINATDNERARPEYNRSNSRPQFRKREGPFQQIQHSIKGARHPPPVPLKEWRVTDDYDTSTTDKGTLQNPTYPGKAKYRKQSDAASLEGE